MMRLEYLDIISPFDLPLNIGAIKKPTLRDVSDSVNGIGYDKYHIYEVMMQLTPNLYYSLIRVDDVVEDGDKYTSLYEIIINDKQIQDTFIEMFNFFFREKVIFIDGVFWLIKQSVKFNGNYEELQTDDICGVIHEDNILEVLSVIRQICGINKEEKETKPKFKNETARKLWEKIEKSNRAKKRKSDLNTTLPNIISAVANRHPSLNWTNIWDITIYQLYESFNRVQTNVLFDMDANRVATWGDEKNTFDISSWYKNNYEKSKDNLTENKEEKSNART